MDFMPTTTAHSRHRLGHSLIVLGLMSLLVFSVLLSSISSSSVVAFGTSTIFELTNKARQENGLGALTLSEDLTTAAQAKAEAMVRDDYFDHTAPDGTTGWDYIEKTDYEYSFAGENLAASNEDDLAVVNGWLKSPGHRANLLDTRFRDIGLGVAYANQYKDYQEVYFIVSLYAAPNTSSIMTSGVTTSPTNGLALFSDNAFTINSRLSYTILVLSGLLLLAGVILEIRKLRQHLVASRRAPIKPTEL